MKTRMFLCGLMLVLLGSLCTARAYHDPGVQRWLNRDPLGEQGGVNVFASVNGDAINMIDSHGTDVRRGWDGEPVHVPSWDTTQPPPQFPFPTFPAPGPEMAWNPYTGSWYTDAGIQTDDSIFAVLLPFCRTPRVNLGAKAESTAVEIGRAKYENAVKDLAQKAADLRKSGMNSEKIAKELHAARRALGEQSKKLTPPDLLKKITERNINKYGDPLGPSVDWLRKQGKTWEDIIDSACRPGGKDLGL